MTIINVRFKITTVPTPAAIDSKVLLFSYNKGES